MGGQDMRARLLTRRRRSPWMTAPIVVALLLAIAVAASPANQPSAGALDCEGVALGDGCLFTITGGDTDDPNDGYAVTNADGVPLWDFVESRDLQAIGYPISQRWVNGPFTLQAFQKVILQWDPGKSRMNYYNTLDVLANRYPDVELPNVPPHQVLEADRGADFATITRNHLALLDQNAAIKARFLSESDWLNLYGLPIRYEEREVNGNPQGLQMLRAQRTVFVIWNVPAPGVTVGRVNLQNVPDKVKKLSNVIIPGRSQGAGAGRSGGLIAGVLAGHARAARPGPPSSRRFASADRARAGRRFYHATDGPNWVNNTSWLSDAPIGEWHGVATDRDGQGHGAATRGQPAYAVSFPSESSASFRQPDRGCHLVGNELHGCDTTRTRQSLQAAVAAARRQPTQRRHPSRAGQPHQPATAAAEREPTEWRNSRPRLGRSRPTLEELLNLSANQLQGSDPRRPGPSHQC